MRQIYLKCFKILNRCGMCSWRTEARAVSRPRRAAAEARGFNPHTRSAAPSRLSHRLITGDLASLHARSYDELFVYLVHRAHRRDVSLTRLAKGTLNRRQEITALFIVLYRNRHRTWPVIVCSNCQCACCALSIT